VVCVCVWGGGAVALLLDPRRDGKRRMVSNSRVLYAPWVGRPGHGAPRGDHVERHVPQGTGATGRPGHQETGASRPHVVQGSIGSSRQQPRRGPAARPQDHRLLVSTGRLLRRAAPTAKPTGPETMLQNTTCVRHPTHSQGHVWREWLSRTNVPFAAPEPGSAATGSWQINDAGLGRK
jgi:hypothetical protein